MRRISLALLAVALIASACSDDDSSDDTTTTTAAAATTQSSTPELVAPLEDYGLSSFPFTNTQSTPGGTIDLGKYEEAFGYAQQPLCGYVGSPADQPAESADCIGLVENSDPSQGDFALEPGDSDSGVNPMCGHPTAYVPNLVAVSADAASSVLGTWTPEDLTGATIETTDELGGTIEYDPPLGVQLFTVPGDPIDEIIDAGILPGFAAPVYVPALAPRWKYGPGADAVPASGTLVVGSGEMTDGGGRVAVIDNFSKDDAAQQFTASHGEFIVGLVNRVNPSATVVAVNPGPIYQAGLVEGEVWLSMAIQSALGGSAEAYANGDIKDRSEPPPTTINLSLGTYPCITKDITDDGEVFTEYTPVYLAEELRSWEDEELGFDVVTVAAAGNDYHDDSGPPFYPAAFNVNDFGFDVVGVGALAWNGGWVEADYSNVVGADIWAPGTALISDSGHPAYALAQWSGTSFATAIVSALEAAGQP